MQSVKEFMKKYGIGIVVGGLLSIAFLVMDSEGLIATMGGNTDSKRYTIVIDSGHGGIDPGKISVDGVYEKNINLAVARRLQKVLSSKDCHIIMTRETDAGLYQESDQNKKRADMANRLQKINESHSDLTISIHQNSYVDATSRGAQVFYYTSSQQGQKLATCIQNTLLQQVDPYNRRQPKANSEYYLLRNSVGTMVIVECGFLSNLQESRQLQEEAYQQKIAEAIAAGVMEYLETRDRGETQDRKEEPDENKNKQNKSGTVSQ